MPAIHLDHMLSQELSDSDDMLLNKTGTKNTVDRDIFAGKIFRLLNFCVV